MTVYAIALINIADRERYGAYQQGFMEILSKYRGSLLAVDEAPTVKEGDWPYSRPHLCYRIEHAGQGRQPPSSPSRKRSSST
jgi:uncharacterized protein (DUF1330 family)